MAVSGINRSRTLTYTLSPQTRPAFVNLYEEQFYTTVRVLAPLWPAIILFGFISNSVNIAVFLKSGANDNMGVLLLSLALSDLTFLTLITPTVCGYVIEAFVRFYSWPVDFMIIFYLLYWPAYNAYDLSTFIAVSLGVMRSACLAMPLKFKLVFTKSKTIIGCFFSRPGCFIATACSNNI